MPITSEQIAQAERQQFRAARDMTDRVRLIAGPGTGKSRCIEERVDYLLAQGVAPDEIYVISFTRASSRDLENRIVRYCSGRSRGEPAQGINVSTMHSLALKILKSANLLQGFPPNADPIILDSWEQEKIFDTEFTKNIPVTPTRAGEVRRAYDAYWQTLQAFELFKVSRPISPEEQNTFEVFHLTSKQVYSCLLPGEVVRRCIDEMRLGNIEPNLLGIRHLVVDEYQDLNACDQEFVQRIAESGANLFVAGDDDQSIYAFRFAAPVGIQTFKEVYPEATSHQLELCFRCTPEVLSPAYSLIRLDPGRIPKALSSLYNESVPPVRGCFDIWGFQTGVEEARAIAQSCKTLIEAGLDPKEILILVSNTKVLLGLLIQEMASLGLPFEQPRGGWMLDDELPRLVHSILRILKNPQDYIAHRTLLGLQRGVGEQTCANISRKTVSANLNFRQLFYSLYPSGVFSSREDRAIRATGEIVRRISAWEIEDTIQARTNDISDIISQWFGSSDSRTSEEGISKWLALIGSLPDEMNLSELADYFASDTEAGQQLILEAVIARLGLATNKGTTDELRQDLTQRIRILTMHGAKGLDGHIVFIPGFEQGIMPHSSSLGYPGLINEQRRLLYMSITRARVACFMSFARNRTGNPAYVLSGRPSIRQNPSSFLNDIDIRPNNRTSGLSSEEVSAIMTDFSNLY